MGALYTSATGDHYRAWRNRVIVELKSYGPQPAALTARSEHVEEAERLRVHGTRSRYSAQDEGARRAHSAGQDVHIRTVNDPVGLSRGIDVLVRWSIERAPNLGEIG